jgi:hypothetical protein
MGKLINDNELILIEAKSFSADEAKEIGEKLKIDWSKFDVEQFRMGLEVELEHGTKNPETNITNNDPIMTGKITAAHLAEFPGYYTALKKMEDSLKNG